MHLLGYPVELAEVAGLISLLIALLAAYYARRFGMRSDAASRTAAAVLLESQLMEVRSSLVAIRESAFQTIDDAKAIRKAIDLLQDDPAAARHPECSGILGLKGMADTALDSVAVTQRNAAAMIERIDRTGRDEVTEIRVAEFRRSAVALADDTGNVQVRFAEARAFVKRSLEAMAKRAEAPEEFTAAPDDPGGEHSDLFARVDELYAVLPSLVFGIEADRLKDVRRNMQTLADAALGQPGKDVLAACDYLEQAFAGKGVQELGSDGKDPLLTLAAIRQLVTDAP